eukprot:Pgem_evm2s18682
MNDMEQTCNFCKLKKNKLLHCSRCKSVYYCNINCQKSNYKQHKNECRKVGKIKEKFDPVQSNQLKQQRITEQIQNLAGTSICCRVCGDTDDLVSVKLFPS